LDSLFFPELQAVTPMIKNKIEIALFMIICGFYGLFFNCFKFQVSGFRFAGQLAKA
jgi:hypothetical protein